MYYQHSICPIDFLEFDLYYSTNYIKKKEDRRAINFDHTFFKQVLKVLLHRYDMKDNQ